MKRIGIAAGLVIILALGVALFPRLREPAAAESPVPSQSFRSHSLRGMTSDQIKDYALDYAGFAKMGQVNSIPFAKIATEKEMHDAGLIGLPEDNYSFAWAIFKGNVAVTVPGGRPGGPKTVPYQILGFDLDSGEPFYTIGSPDGTGLGKLVGDPSLPPPVSMSPPPHDHDAPISKPKLKPDPNATPPPGTPPYYLRH